MRSQSMLIGAGSKIPTKRPLPCYCREFSQGLLRLNRIPQKTLPTYICTLSRLSGTCFSIFIFSPSPHPIESANRHIERHAIPSLARITTASFKTPGGEGEGSALLLSISMQYCDPPDLRSRFLGLTINFAEPTGRNKAWLRNGMPLSWRFSYARLVSGHEFTRAEKIPSPICLLSEAPRESCTEMAHGRVVEGSRRFLYNHA
jgi:hypothetical protein